MLSYVILNLKAEIQWLIHLAIPHMRASRHLANFAPQDIFKNLMIYIISKPSFNLHILMISSNLWILGYNKSGPNNFNH